MSRKKPRGIHGGIRVGPGSGKSTFHNLPDSKEGIERYYVDLVFGASSDLRSFYESTTLPVQSHENGHDFILETRNGTEYLELMEAAPLDELQTTFDKAPAGYSNGEFADLIWRGIEKKSSAYTPGVHLLIYATDGKFQLVEAVCTLLALSLAKKAHQFKSVVSVRALPGGDDCQFDVLFPQERAAFTGIDEASLRRGAYAIGDMSKVEYSANGATATVPLGPLKSDGIMNSEVVITIRGRKAPKTDDR